jgi:hypothetical protein
MQDRSVSLRIPEVGFIAATRVALGVGIGLFLADRMNLQQRKRVSRALLAIGVGTTIPIFVNVIRRARSNFQLAA